MVHRPLAGIGLLAVFGGLAAVFTGLQGRRESHAVAGSALFITGLMIAGATGVFPVLLHSTLVPENSLSAYQSAAGGHGLAIALVWWPLALLFSAGYFAFIYRHYRSKVKSAEDTQNPY
jgi:cytochrome d ubiquinol oxidase subunit II